MNRDKRPRSLGICQRTGFKVPRSELRREWTGLLVWEPYWEPKHPEYDRPPPRGERVVDRATARESERHLEPGEITWDDL